MVYFGEASSREDLCCYHHHLSLRRVIPEEFGKISKEKLGDYRGVVGEEIRGNVLESSCSLEDSCIFIMENEGVLSMIYFIVLSLVDHSWIIFVMTS